jgi:membrane fusion protein
MDAERKTPLFRQELIDHFAHRLHGEVSIAVPISWQTIGYFLFATLVVALIFLCTASYARVEAVGGAIALDKGVVSIVPTRPGVVTDILAHEGARVSAGQPVLTIRSEEDSGRGDTAPERILAALDAQDHSLKMQAALLTESSAAEQARLTEQARGISDEIARLDTQIAVQERLVRLAQGFLHRAQEIAAQGYISGHDRDASEADLLTKRQQLLQLQQARAAKSAELHAARRAMAQSATNAEAQIAGLSSNRAQVAQQVAQARAAQGYALTSPVSGTVTALTARVGQPSSPPSPTMLVVPDDTRPLAELQVPSSAVGFLEVGQAVRLNIDAFPYERFGVVEGRIASIATAATLRQMPDGKSAPVYLVNVELPNPWIMAFGRKQSLLAGMTLSARIVTRRQTLLEWLFEPIFAVKRR